MITFKSINMIHFMGHEASTLKLPDTGVVLLTGKNGAGKSAFVECASMSLFGKSIRGDTPWPDDDGSKSIALAASSVVINDREITAARSHNSLRWNDLNHQTPSKAQKELARYVGDQDSWQRACVLTSEDLGTFTRLTGAPRIRLLEKLLMLDRFDDALERATFDRNTASVDVEASSEDLRNVKGDWARADGTLRRAYESHAALGEKPEPVDMEELDALVTTRKAQVREYVTACHQADKELKALVKTRPGAHPFEKKFDRLKKGICPTCEQAVDAGPLEELRMAISKQQAAAVEHNTLYDAANAVATKATNLLDRGRSLMHDAEMAAQRGRMHNESCSSRAAVFAASADAVAKAMVTEQQLREEIVSLEVEQDACKKHLELLETSVFVLGTRGVRASILSNSLKQIERIANTWAKRLGDVEIQLAPRRAKKNKSTEFVEEITLSVRHAERKDWHSFKALSSGQKRRVDVAMLFALSEISRAVRGTTAGTIFCDEVDVNLDEEGVEKLAHVLDEMSHDRCVVVLSPNERIVQYLEPALHLRVYRGTIA